MPFLFTDLLLLLALGLVIYGLRTFIRAEANARAIARFRADRVGKICACIVAGYLGVGVLESCYIAPQRTVLDLLFQNVPRENGYSAPLARHDTNERNPKPLLGRHLLGTDLLGRDVFHQTLKGCRTALLIGGLTSALYIPIGVLLGLLAGYCRRWTDDGIQYLYSTVSSIPGVLLIVAVLMALGQGLHWMALAMSLTAWVGICRIIRGETLRQTARPYIEAAHALGQSHLRILTRHLLPNVLHLILINAVLGFSGFVLAESVLSYLGVGAPIGTASWGVMIDSARMELSREPAIWWNLTAATGALFLLVLTINLLGDALRRAFDPKG